MQGNVISSTPPAKWSKGSDLHAHLLKWIEHKLNRNIVRNPFEHQERAARHPNRLAASRLLPSPQRDADPFSQLLKQEHRTSPDRKAVLRLPKLPFGLHRTYNEVESFSQEHIVWEQPSPTQLAEIQGINRKYRLADKRKRRQHRAFPSQSPPTKYDTYRIDSGLLYCPKDTSRLQSYDNDKRRYAGVLDLTLKLADSPRPHHFRGQSLPSSTRLYPGRPADSPSRISEAMAQKYQMLFGDREEGV